MKQGDDGFWSSVSNTSNGAFTVTIRRENNTWCSIDGMRYSMMWCCTVGCVAAVSCSWTKDILEIHFSISAHIPRVRGLYFIIHYPHWTQLKMNGWNTRNSFNQACRSRITVRTEHKQLWAEHKCLVALWFTQRTIVLHDVALLPAAEFPMLL